MTRTYVVIYAFYDLFILAQKSNVKENRPFFPDSFSTSVRNGYCMEVTHTHTQARAHTHTKYI